MAEDPTSRLRAFALVALSYAAATLAAVMTLAWLPVENPVVATMWADVVATVVIFAFSYAFDNSSFYDPYWSIAPMVIGVYWAMFPESVDANVTRQLLVVALVFAWGGRLTWNWMRQWAGLGHEDWRYVDLRKQYPFWWYAISFSGIHMMPTLLVFLGCLSLWAPLVTSDAGLGVLDLLAVGVTVTGILFEGIADNQLRAFVSGPREPEDILDTGLWAWSRHPNYFGEITFWWGLYVFTLAADPLYWWTIVGPGSITLLFLFISLPMIEKRMIAKRPGFKEHMKKVPILFPWPPSK